MGNLQRFTSLASCARNGRDGVAVRSWGTGNARRRPVVGRLLALIVGAGALLGCADSASDGAAANSAADSGANTAVAAAPATGDYSSAWGPAKGSTIPLLAATDHQGQPQTLASLSGEKGLLLVFSRSADW